MVNLVRQRKPEWLYWVGLRRWFRWNSGRFNGGSLPGGGGGRFSPPWCRWRAPILPPAAARRAPSRPPGIHPPRSGATWPRHPEPRAVKKTGSKHFRLTLQNKTIHERCHQKENVPLTQQTPNIFKWRKCTYGVWSRRWLDLKLKYKFSPVVRRSNPE